jgi:hypothetical protein
VEKARYLVTINGQFEYRVWAYDAVGACQKAGLVYDQVNRDPSPAEIVTAQRDA